MIRARAGREDTHPARLLPIVAVSFLLAACIGGSTDGPGRSDAGSPSSAPSATVASTVEPSMPIEPSATPTIEPGTTETPGAATDEPTSAPDGCTGSDANREFFRQAAASMSWSVYCAVLDAGWFLETGSYRLANGGHLEVTYRGPGDAHVAIAEGNICEGADVDTCAPRDSVISPAAFGDVDGTLGRLSNGLVLDVDRGTTPSWRATGLGLTEDAFRSICAAFIVVPG